MGWRLKLEGLGFNSIKLNEVDRLERPFEEMEVYEVRGSLINATFLALIPKKVGAEKVKEFQPISLVNGALSRMSLALVADGLVAGFKIGSPNRGLVNISHLLFADDTLFFCEVDPYQIRVLKALLLFFEATSGLKVNLQK
ncbi:uncharacterized protein LOC122296902 [Carya illinoinensis]|uniref:uncharacterized protein LOC122296902 n=1 Tax=Carya illinoinensis TaxID=32201 RepID=UPI001C720EE6|nr:uncharacterized protein LOC122296902 [Carya illinoinensis]